MIRADIITAVGRTYLTSNIENDEYSYSFVFLYGFASRKI